ncbi:galactose-6-phosphate isomerase [Streptococcus pneumoniae]|uniref:galactose-6-phosphate isomerase n=1 Tax=Streptococcus pneumoniae TaxID=1313 RepID=UPI0002F8F007
MSQSIVPVEIPQYCRFDSKKRNGILFNVRIANLKFIFLYYTSCETKHGIVVL